MLYPSTVVVPPRGILFEGNRPSHCRAAVILAWAKKEGNDFFDVRGGCVKLSVLSTSFAVSLRAVEIF